MLLQYQPTQKIARFYGLMRGTSASYFFDPAELFCFFPLVKILNFGLQNELQNTRGRQSKKSLSQFQSTWSKNLRNIFLAIFCDFSVNKREIGPPNKF